MAEQPRDQNPNTGENAPSGYSFHHPRASTLGQDGPQVGSSKSQDKQPRTEDYQANEHRRGFPGNHHGYHSHGPRFPHHHPLGPDFFARGGHGSGYGRGGRGGPWGGRRSFKPSDMWEPYAAFLGNLGQLPPFFFGEADSEEPTDQSFNPEVDLFDTPDSFVVHVSLPGAKKEDLAVNWDAETSDLIITGVVHRPGDEELLKALVSDERRVGVFERKVRLGSRAKPALVDVAGLSARMEDGVLRVKLPKLDVGQVEVKKVEIE